MGSTCLSSRGYQAIAVHRRNQEIGNKELAQNMTSLTLIIIMLVSSILHLASGQSISPYTLPGLDDTNCRVALQGMHVLGEASPGLASKQKFY
jgi:hypothetical protein